MSVQPGRTRVSPFLILFSLCLSCGMLFACRDQGEGDRPALRESPSPPAEPAPLLVTPAPATPDLATSSPVGGAVSGEPSAMESAPDEVTRPTQSVSADAFAIYVLGEQSSQDLGDLSRLTLPDQPLLTLDDILAYEPESHLVQLLPGVSDRLDSAELPGKSFVVASGREPCYAGLFMAAYMSRSFDGVVILWPSMTVDEHSFQIQLGYPGPDFFAGRDPRSDASLMDALRQAGKLPQS